MDGYRKQLIWGLWKEANMLVWLYKACLILRHVYHQCLEDRGLTFLMFQRYSLEKMFLLCLSTVKTTQILWATGLPLHYPFSNMQHRPRGLQLISYPWAAQGKMIMIHLWTALWRAIKRTHSLQNSQHCLFIVKTEIRFITANTLGTLLLIVPGKKKNK